MTRETKFQRPVSKEKDEQTSRRRQLSPSCSRRPKRKCPSIRCTCPCSSHASAASNAAVLHARRVCGQSVLPSPRRILRLMLACSVCPWTRTSEQARSSSRCYGSSVVVAVKKSRRSSVVSFRLRHPDNDTYAGAQEKRPALRDLSNKAGGNFLQPNAGAKVCSFRPSVPGPWSPTHRSSALQPLKSHAPIADSRSTRANSARSEEPVQRFQNLSVGSGRDIDAHDHKDQMANTEYVNDIFRNLLKDEVSSRCDCDRPVRVSVPIVAIGLAQLAVCSASTRRCRTTRKSKPTSTSGCARS